MKKNKVFFEGQLDTLPVFFKNFKIINLANPEHQSEHRTDSFAYYGSSNSFCLKPYKPISKIYIPDVS